MREAVLCLLLGSSLGALVTDPQVNKDVSFLRISHISTAFFSGIQQFQLKSVNPPWIVSRDFSLVAHSVKEIRSLEEVSKTSEVK